VAALIKDFTERHLRKRRRRPEYAERILQKELAGWSHRDARTIKLREVIELLDAIVERPAPVMANRVADCSHRCSGLESIGRLSRLPGSAALSPGAPNDRASAPR